MKKRNSLKQRETCRVDWTGCISLPYYLLSHYIVIVSFIYSIFLCLLHVLFLFSPSSPATKTTTTTTATSYGGWTTTHPFLNSLLSSFSLRTCYILLIAYNRSGVCAFTFTSHDHLVASSSSSSLLQYLFHILFESLSIVLGYLYCIVHTC